MARKTKSDLICPGNKDNCRGYEEETEACCPDSGYTRCKYATKDKRILPDEYNPKLWGSNKNTRRCSHR